MLGTRQIHFLFFLLLCSCKSLAGVHFFQPPVLDVQSISIDVDTNSTLEINCIGKHPVYWKIPTSKDGVNNDTRLTVRSSFDTSQSVNKFKSKLTLQDVYYMDTGFYSCYYDDTKDFSYRDNVTSVYVFVNDPEVLFVDNSNILEGHLMVGLQQNKKGLIPCLPTSSQVNVTLWKTEAEDDIGEIVTLGNDVTFDPKIGFYLFYPTFYFSGLFQCRAELGSATQKISLTLFYMPDTYHDPQPFIDKAQAQHPVVNGTFTLKCSVNVDPGTGVFFDWSYPNKNDTSGRINETKPTPTRKTVRNYIHEEVTTYLIVKNVQPSDSGTYRCTVTDHSQKTGSDEKNIFVYASKQPNHVNFSTDIDLSGPIVYQAGQNVRFVITVRAFPSIEDVELFWMKDKSLLQSDSHYQLKTTPTSKILEIRGLLRSDAAVYTLYGKTADMTNSISIMLEVKDKPLVSVQNTQTIYTLGGEYTLECHADGYPQPIVWWRWKPCMQIKRCDAGGPYGWTDVDPYSGPFNSDNVTWEVSDVKNYSQVLYLHVTANYSGHYMCVASNVMGKDDSVIPFIVTDAKEGFEISISNRRPIDQDRVTIICKVNSFNFSSVQWKWRPMVGNGSLVPLENISDVKIFLSDSVYSHSAFIIFDPMHLNMSGEYECIATYDQTNLSESQHITVEVKEIQKPVMNSTNMRGITIITSPSTLQEFYCYAYGVPFPEIYWRKNGKILDLRNITRIGLTERNQKMTIKRVLEKDAGFYECSIKNRGGMVRANATLNVLAGKNAYLQTSLTAGEVTIIFVFAVVGVILSILVFCLVKRIRNERRQKKELDFMSHSRFERGYVDIFNPNLPVEDQIDLLPYRQHWEFPKERLKLGKTLGQGAFGRVVKAEAIGLVDGEASTTVAVKMLKEAANNEQRKALIAELKILIHIGQHLNIVNLLGAVTKNLAKGELYVIVEYCCYGNLRHFLLKHKGSFIDQLDHKTGNLDPQISSLPGSPFINMEDNMVVYSNILGIGMDNPTYREQSLHYADLAHRQVTNDSGTGISVITNPSGSTVNDKYFGSTLSSSPLAGENDCYSEETAKSNFITTCDLLCYAFQCARGMKYLTSKKLIHRDLAARNVLLAKDNVVKICDFGLAKDCYKYSNYIKKSDGLLPIKWMAIESIRDRVFTSKSDVWSFGVLLWELFTLGGNPYPGTEINEEFFKKLKNGYRMERPDYAPECIYQLMKNCWLDDPLQRPDFGTLEEKVGALLESSVRKYYVELNTPYQMMNEELLNNNDYLQMDGSLEEYTNMEENFDPEDQNMDPHINYDNLPPIKPIGSDPIPKAPMEVVPMIQLERMLEPWTDANSVPFPEHDINKTIPTNILYEEDSVIHRNGGQYLKDSPEKVHEVDEHDAVFLEQKPASKPYYVNGDCTSVPLLQNYCMIKDQTLHAI